VWGSCSLKIPLLLECECRLFSDLMTESSQNCRQNKLQRITAYIWNGNKMKSEKKISTIYIHFLCVHVCVCVCVCARARARVCMYVCLNVNTGRLYNHRESNFNAV
jgi:hypothetical protein